jgi:hypothetical protein
MFPAILAYLGDMRKNTVEIGPSQMQQRSYNCASLPLENMTTSCQSKPHTGQQDQNATTWAEKAIQIIAFKTHFMSCVNSCETEGGLCLAANGSSPGLAE